MEKFEITNVGISVDSLQFIDGVVFGTATVYSKDLDDELDVEYCDDFDFTYDTAGDFATIDLDDQIFGEYTEIIEAKLIDNLKTNFMDGIELYATKR